MRYHEFLLEDQRIRESFGSSVKEFMEMVSDYFAEFASDVKRLSHDFTNPWKSKVDVMKMKRDGWKVKRHSMSMAHELWVLVKDGKEEMVGY